MADTTLAHVEELAKTLPPGEQRLLAESLLFHLTHADSVDQPKTKRSAKEIDDILDATRGAWGTGKTPDQIDQEIREMRDRDWFRDWEKLGNE